MLPDHGQSGLIVFYDGHCGLCDRLVAFLAQRDRRELLRFAPLHGSTAAEVLPGEDRIRVDTVIVQRGNQRLYRSTAAILAVSALGGPWALTRFLLLVPRALRDLAYDWVARRRTRWFGQHEACSPPPAGAGSRFLP